MISGHKTSIGLDIGHSTVKIGFSVGGVVKRIIFPSVARAAFKISDEAESVKAEKETVKVNGVDYFFGDTAHFHSAGIVANGLVDDWIEKPEHMALLLGAFKKIAEAGVDIRNTVLWLGLPTNLYARYKDRLKEVVGLMVSPDEIRVMPQSVAPFQTICWDALGFPAEGGRVIAEQSWAIVDVGYYTTDFGLIDKGRYFQGSEGACKGVHVAAERLSRTLASQTPSFNCSLAECDEALRNKFIRVFNTKHDVSLAVEEALSEIVIKVVDEAVRLMNDKARTITGVLVAGGGAPLVIDHLFAQWPHAQLAEDSRFAVAEGLRRAGEADLRQRGFPVAA